jgi:hypothetical protein
MGQDESQERAQQLSVEGEKTPAQLRAEIEDVREDLGDTAAALAAKTDVKTRAREKADELKRTATDKKDDLLAKVGRSPSTANGSRTSGGASSALSHVQTQARQKPVLTAALGALVGGIVIGRLTRRRAGDT